MAEQRAQMEEPEGTRPFQQSAAVAVVVPPLLLLAVEAVAVPCNASRGRMRLQSRLCLLLLRPRQYRLLRLVIGRRHRYSRCRCCYQWLHPSASW